MTTRVGGAHRRGLLSPITPQSAAAADASTGASAGESAGTSTTRKRRTRAELYGDLRTRQSLRLQGDEDGADPQSVAKSFVGSGVFAAL